MPRIEAFTRNLGAGGAFVLCADPLPVGTRVDLTLRLPRPRRDIEVTAEVRWRITEGGEPDGVGMGIKFVALAIEDTIALQEYFASLTGLDTPA